MHLATERDYKSFPDYDTNAYREQRDAYLNNVTDSGYLNYVRNMGTMTPARKPQMGIAASHHRRTLSNISSPNNNVNPSPCYPPADKDECPPSNYQYGRINQLTKRLTSISPINHTPNRMRTYENIPFNRPSDQMPTNAFIPSASSEYQSCIVDRPDSLAFDMANGTKLRSSLRKYSNSSPRFANNSSLSNFPLTQQSAIMHKTSPTKTTPSDSLTSDDSSYLSAKDSSISSQSRVRFSPETLLLDEPSSMMTMATASNKRLSRSQRHSISDMLAPETNS